MQQRKKSCLETYGHQVALLVEMLEEQFLENQPIDNTTALVKVAREAGLELGTHYREFKMLYDIAEFALQEACHTALVADPNHPRALFQQMAALLPTETERSRTSIEMQQYSTPIDLGWKISTLMAVTGRDNVLEPSAGTGALLLQARLQGSKILANELNEDRRFLLSLINDISLFGEDAQFLQHLPKLRGHRISCVLMNPPFSRSANQSSKMDPLAGLKHVKAAFELTTEDGRLAAILGPGVLKNKRTRTYFQQSIGEQYLALYQELDKSWFKQKGTAFKCSLLILDRDKTRHHTYKEVLDYLL